MHPRHPPRRHATIDAVLSNPDLIAHILRSNVGPSTFVAARRICRAWLAVCRTDESVLRAVALFQGGLTRTAFRGLFGFTSAESHEYAHTKRLRFGGGEYYLYTQLAVEQALARGGMAQVANRLKRRSQLCLHMPLRDLSADSINAAMRRVHRSMQEESLHRRANVGCIGARRPLIVR